MRTRTLGGATVTSIGSGDISLAIAAARGVDSREVERALHAAISVGVTMFDVHDETDAERLVGLAARTLRARDRLVIATRIVAVPPRPGAPYRDLLPERLPVAYVQERVEASLRATALDVLPLVQLPVRPAWQTSTAWAELVGTAARLVREGKVLRWGVSIDPTDAAARPQSSLITVVTDEIAAAYTAAIPLTAEPWIASIAVPYNLCDRRADPLIAAARGHELAVLARQPLAGGVLSGFLGPGVRLTHRDDRNELDPAVFERSAVIAAKLAALVRREPPAARSSDAARAARERARRPDHVECNTVAELALRFVIDADTIALPRLHRHEHLPEALIAGGSPALTGDLISRLLDEKLDAIA